MPNHINAAARLLLILQRARNSPGPHAYEAWADAMGLPKDQNHWTAAGVMQRLVWLQGEVNAIRQGMKDKNFSESLYEPALAQVQNAFQILNLGVGWDGNGRNALSAEVLTSIGYCREILPDEESEVKEEDLADIRSTMAELEVLVQITSLPPTLRAIVQHHIDLIHEALDKYPFVGVVALREAAWTAAGELLQAESDPVLGDGNFAERPEVAKLNGLWGKVNAVTEGASKANSLFELGNNVAEALSNLSQ